MKEYRIKWEIDLMAKDPIEAAKEALDSIINGDAKFFTVVSLDKEDKGVETSVDLGIEETD